jgi:ribose transport system permease protein
MSTQLPTPPNQAPPKAEPTASDQSARKTQSQEFLHRLIRVSWIWILMVEIALVVVFSLMKPGEFFTADNIRNIFSDASILLVLGVGMTYVIITAGIDLSVGSVLVFSGVIAAKVMGDLGFPPFLGLISAVVAGTAWGILNGVLVAKAKVPPLIVTLGTLGMALGASQLITSGIDVVGVQSTLTDKIAFGRIFGQVPILVVIAGAVAALGAIWLSLTRYGRYTLAVGSNPEAVRRAGINVDRHLIKVYALMGMLAGFAGFLNLARFSSTTIAGHSTDNLQAIAAVVLGGTSLFGGVGSVVGTTIGVLIPVTLNYGFVVIGVQPFWQTIAVGAVLIVAVYFDQLRRRRRQ